MVSNIKSPSLPIPKVNRPKCPKHLKEMTFNTKRARWACMVADCKVVARHKEEEVAASTVLPSTLRLQVDRGADEEFRYLIHVNEGDTTRIIDVTDYTEMVIDDASGSTATLCLLIAYTTQ